MDILAVEAVIWLYARFILSFRDVEEVLVRERHAIYVVLIWLSERSSMLLDCMSAQELLS